MRGLRIDDAVLTLLLTLTCARLLTSPQAAVVITARDATHYRAPFAVHLFRSQLLGSIAYFNIAAILSLSKPAAQLSFVKFMV